MAATKHQDSPWLPRLLVAAGKYALWSGRGVKPVDQSEAEAPLGLLLVTTVDMALALEVSK